MNNKKKSKWEIVANKKNNILPFFVLFVPVKMKRRKIISFCSIYSPFFGLFFYLWHEERGSKISGYSLLVTESSISTSAHITRNTIDIGMKWKQNETKKRRKNLNPNV